uniref:Aa_trans domain-containing protein n=1 Tax=Angiostrongylus cantonensis TaxID=6313 RepID=A0A0K0D4X2_ANGCA
LCFSMEVNVCLVETEILVLTRKLEKADEPSDAVDSSGYKLPRYFGLFLGAPVLTIGIVIS